MDDADEAVIAELVNLFMPERAMTLQESEDLGRLIYDGARAYCFQHFPAWRPAQVQELADIVRKRIEWKLMDKRRKSPA